MNIAILNECFLESTHLARLRKLGHVAVYTGTKTEREAIERLKGIDVAVIHCSLLPITGKILRGVSALKYISLASTGYDLVDVEAARKSKILISNLPTYGTESVSEHAIALMFTIVRHVVELEHLFRKNPYEINSIPDIVESPYRSFSLRGKTLGIIGLGRIGSRVAEMALGIGMNVIAHDCVKRSMKNVRMVSLVQLLKQSDVVTIHTLLDKTTKKLMGPREFGLMKKTAIFINTARGGIVDQKALYQALKAKKILAAGLDTIDDRKKTNPLLHQPNVVFTPHSAWYSDESCRNIADIVTSNVEAFIHGKPINLVV